MGNSDLTLGRWTNACQVSAHCLNFDFDDPNLTTTKKIFKAQILNLNISIIPNFEGSIMFKGPTSYIYKFLRANMFAYTNSDFQNFEGPKLEQCLQNV